MLLIPSLGQSATGSIATEGPSPPKIVGGDYKAHHPSSPVIPGKLKLHGGQPNYMLVQLSLA